MKIPEADTVVIPDLHGRVEQLEDVYERYGEDVRYVLLGDIVDGTEVKHTLDIVSFMITELGGVALKGNHEYVLDAALSAADTEEQYRFRYELWRRSRKGGYTGYEQGTLSSYQIDDRAPTALAAEQLRERMKTTGHLALIREMPVIVEAPDFIAVHAGLTAEPWIKQSQDLEHEEKQLTSENPSFSEEPDQLFGQWISKNGRTCRDQSISSSPELFTDIGGRALITGHSHINCDVEGRVSSNGQRVRLASRLDKGSPLFVYQTWDRQVVAI